MTRKTLLLFALIDLIVVAASGVAVAATSPGQVYTKSMEVPSMKRTMLLFSVVAVVALMFAPAASAQQHDHNNMMMNDDNNMMSASLSASAMMSASPSVSPSASATMSATPSATPSATASMSASPSAAATTLPSTGGPGAPPLGLLFTLVGTLALVGSGVFALVLMGAPLRRKRY